MAVTQRVQLQYASAILGYASANQTYFGVVTDVLGLIAGRLFVSALSTVIWGKCVLRYWSCSSGEGMKLATLPLNLLEESPNRCIDLQSAP